MDPILSSVLNLGGVGIIAAILAWRVIPSMLATFSAEQQALRESHDKHIEKLVGRLDNVEAAVRALADGREDTRRNPFGLPLR